MGLQIDFPAALYEGVRKSLLRSRCLAWAALLVALTLGFCISALLNDVTQFGRIGAFGVIIGIAFARWRFVVLKNAERKLERALRNPEKWFVESVRRQSPGLPVRLGDNQQTFSRDQVEATLDTLIEKIDRTIFLDESLIVAISTIVWAYGDIFVGKLLGN